LEPAKEQTAEELAKAAEEAAKDKASLNRSEATVKRGDGKYTGPLINA